jgi:curved DNA-binding protein CbpA
VAPKVAKKTGSESGSETGEPAFQTWSHKPPREFRIPRFFANLPDQAPLEPNAWATASSESPKSLMSLPPTRPKQKPNLNWRSLPIGPAEAFVLSQVDGYADFAQLVLTTGLPEPELREILNRLEQLGAIEGGGASPAKSPAGGLQSGGLQTGPSTSSPPASPKPSSSAAPRASEAAPRSPLPLLPLGEYDSRADSPVSYDVRLLDEPADLDVEFKAQILELEAKLHRHTHYELLGVKESAEKSTVKDAFFTLINLYHVDRYFGKDLGIFRTKLERISTALTKAHDTLSRKKTRSEYDAYLESRRETRGIRDSLPPTRFPSDPPEAESSEKEVRLHEGPPNEPSPSDAPPDSPDAERTVVVLDPNLQRRLLARRLGHRPGTSPSDNPTTDPVVDPFAVRERVARDMKARYDLRHGEARAQAQMYVDMAKTAQSEKKWGSAINALRVAQGLLPESAEIKELLTQVTATADRELADKFADQAKYEQRDGYHDRAMRSYERAGRGKESAGQLEEAGRFFHEAAVCAVREGTDPKKVAELARRAVAANGKKVEYRVDLARAYERLGMRSSAQGEVQRALDLEPDNQAAQALQKQLR